MDDIFPTSKIARGGVVGKTMFKIALKHSSSFDKHSLSSSDKQQKIKEQNHKDIAQMMFDTLGHLKGVSA